MSSDQTSLSDILQYNGIVLGILGVLASFIFTGIVFILGFDVTNILFQVVLLMLFLAFLFAVDSAQIFLMSLFETFMTRGGLWKTKTRLRVKVGNTLFISAEILWLTSVPVLFFARDFFHLGVVSTILMAISLILSYFRLWRPSLKGRSFI